MSLKGLFDDVAVTKIVDNKTSAEIGRVVESADYHEADIIDEKRFIPSIDFSEPKNFAKYGSAQQYYEDSYTYIYSSYPYDGSLAEKLQWKNSGSYIDLHIFENNYPRTTGYINFSYGGWGTHGTAPNSGSNNGYGTPQSSDLEYISIKGGPGTGGGIQSQSANVWDPANNRESNLEVDPVEGVTVEFWLKKDDFTVSNTSKEVIFDLWNNKLSSSAEYGRFRVELTGASGLDSNWLVTLVSGTTGFQWREIGNTTLASVTDGKWHHYAFSFLSASNGIAARSYTDGTLQTTETLGSVGIGKIRGSIQANLGAVITTPSADIFDGLNMTGSGKLSASLDEFRYWKTKRSSEKIGRYWFTQVGGGTNTDLANTDLGVYYKFNEGITQVSSTDSIILDYSGRVTNGSWTGYAAGARSTGSAMVLASATTAEFHDPIIYSAHPDVISTLSVLKASGSVHDVENPSEFFGFFPSWMQLQDPSNGDELKKLTQIISSYLDTLYLQIESFGNIHDISYLSGSAEKANTIAGRLLASKGLLAPELFLDADILEYLGDRSEKREYRDSISNIKNKIYQNIYNNLVNIYKAKGTRQSFRNLLRCFGVDEKIYKLNVYGNNVQFKVRNNRELYSANKRYIDFSKNTRFESTVFLSASGDANTVSYISSSTALTGGYANTLESYIFFPRVPEASEKAYSDHRFDYLSSSLFGQHAADPDPFILTWEVSDSTNFQVYAIRDDYNSKDARFVLTSSAGGAMVELTSSYYDDVYTNTNWIFAVTVKPSQYPLVNYVASSSALYDVEFKGTQVDAGEVLNSFTVTSSLDASSIGYGFLTGSKRVYVGAHRQDFEGSVLARSDVRVGFCRYWLDDIPLDLMMDHGRDVQNYGTKNPSRSPYLFQGAQSIDAEFLEPDTLALNWDFETVTGSDAAGEFIVADFSSGSTQTQSSQFGFLGNILGAQHTGYGYGFPASSTDVIDADYVLAAELQDFERLNSNDMISVLSVADDVEFTRESRPTNFLYAIEKSMYQSISENMVRMFGVITDFNNIIGSPVNKYRDNYKSLRILREKFFQRVGNTPDLDKYVEFYKWFDSSLSKILEQLIPASAEFSKEIRTIVESHMLERSKYQHKFPTIDLKAADIIGSVLSPLPLSPGWKFTHHPVNDQQNTNANYWKNKASRYEGKLASPDVDVNNDKQIYFDNSTKETRGRKERNVYRFLSNRQITIQAGTTPHKNKKSNFVFDATAPYGPMVAGTNAIQNIMVSHRADVEVLQDIADDLTPGKNKRLGFGIDPTININPVASKQDGNVLAPFSLFSSSVTTGYNSEVVGSWTSSVLLTNLHEDIVLTNETRPLQGPFTEKFVGGRQYRHTAINPGTGSNGVADIPATRAEGWKIQFEGVSSSGGDFFSSALAIVPPNYDSADTTGYDKDIPIAPYLRDESSKRPVNIKNILMTTASAGTRLSGTLLHNKIGNYSKNYQVIQSAGRTINDPFFQDQSFNFALYPETLSTRGAFPLHSQARKSLLFDGSNDYITAGDATGWDNVIGGAGANSKAVSFSGWIKATTFPAGYWIFKLGTAGGASANFSLMVHSSAGIKFAVGKSGSPTYTLSNPLSTGRWYHYVATVAAGTGNTPNIYINGTLDNNTVFSTTDSLAINNPLIIGHASTAFNGRMCDFAVWNKELSAAEVSTIYGNGGRVNLRQVDQDSLNGGLDATTNLVAWYPLGDSLLDRVATFNSQIIDQMEFAFGIPSNFPTTALDGEHSPPYADYGSLNENPAGNLDYTLPNRTGADSNQTIFVNLFSAPGGYEVQSRGYLGPPHEEKSVYNALPYRNLSVLNYGSLHGTSSHVNMVGEDPTLTGHIRVVYLSCSTGDVNSSIGSELDDVRGLRQRLVPHNSPFGYDSSYPIARKAGIADIPAYYKVNRNTRKRVLYNDTPGGASGEGVKTYITSSVYDNWYIHRPIPGSEQQYLWISSSMENIPGSSGIPYTLFGYSELSGGYFVKSLPLVSQSVVLSAENTGDFRSCGYTALQAANLGFDKVIPVDFVGLSTIVLDPVSASLNQLGFSSLEIDPTLVFGSFTLSDSNYINMTFVDLGLYTAPTVPVSGGHNWSAGNATILNSILLNRNGPYGWPSWKQIRTGEHPVSRNHRKNCILSVRVKTGTDINLGARKGNAITHFTEPQVYSSEFPLTHKFTLKSPPQTGPGPHFAINPDLGHRTLMSSYGNKLINFANYEANNILDVRHNYDSGDLYFNRINSMIMEGRNNDPAFAQLLSKIGASYAQTVYPAAYNAFLERTRARKYYSIANIWNNRRDSRSLYSPTAAALTNSQGIAIPVGTVASMLQKPSVWPLDAHTSTFVGEGLGPGYSGSVSWAYDDGAGELQNSYSRFFVKQAFDPSKGTDNVIIYPAATYNARVLLGTVYGRTPVDSTTIVSCSAIVGDRFNLVAGTFEANNNNAGSGKYPYKTYPEYAKYLRLIGKDYSIVPEFRISEHMDDYLRSGDYTTLKDIDDLLDLTGSSEEGDMGPETRSARPGFFKEYGNSDFMKMFDVIDDEYDGASLVDGSKMSQDKIGLRCNALLQFLPYKGFYPAERTLELASLFSQSFGDNIIKSGSGVAHPAVYRAILEPLYSPGIMFNTIKSGIAVSNFIISNTCSDLVAPPVHTCGHNGPVGNSISASMVINKATSSLPEGNLHFMHMLPPFKTFTGAPNGEYSSSYWEENGYFFQKVPFEALYSPRNYLSSHFISGSGRIYDTGLGSSSLEEYATYMGDTSAQNYVTWDGQGDKLYELAIDNFLCETVNFFENGLTSIVSDREENFGAAKSGSAYTMTMRLYRPTIPNPGYAWGDEHDDALGDYTKTTIPDFDKFDMYRRISAFGPPIASKTWDGTSPYPGAIAGDFPGKGPSFSASFSHLTPPYYAGSGSCTFTFTATYDGAPTLDEIFANMEVSFERMEIVPLHNGGPGTYKSSYPLKVMMKDSFNLTASISSVPEGSGELKNQWLIQSKFETPIINIAGDRGGDSREADAFYGLLPESVPSGTHIPAGSTQTSNQDLRCWGLWHDYGSIPSGSDEGVFAIIDSPSPKEGNSLAKLVGMPIGKPFRIGEIKKSNLLEEAVVAIPFFVGKDGRRKFYRLDKKSKNSIKQVSKHLLKYVFPPRFDFNINRDMDPVAMYVFEFGMEVSQQDIADMWQNLPPSINERFAQKVSVIEHKLLKDQMINKTNRKLRSDLRWLVFKVKKRAESDYSRFTKKGLVNNLNVIPSNIENSRYSYNWPYDYFSLVELVKIDEVIEYASELPPDSRVEIVGEVSLTPPAPTEVRRELMGVQSHGIELWRVYMSDGTNYVDRVNPEFE